MENAMVYWTKGLTVVAWVIFLLVALLVTQAGPPAESPWPSTSETTGAPKLVPQMGHLMVASIAFSPNGRHILSGGVDAALKLWDVATGRELQTFVGHTGT